MSIQVCQKLKHANSLIQSGSLSLSGVTSAKAAAALLQENATAILSSVKGLGILKNQDLIDIKARVVLVGKQYKSLADNVRSGRWGKRELNSKLSSIASSSRELKEDIGKVIEYMQKSEEIAAKHSDSQYQTELAEFKKTQALRAKNGLSTEVDDHGRAIVAPQRRVVLDDGISAAARSSILIQDYTTKFKDKIPARVKVLHVEQLPIYVKFGNARVTTERLNNLEIKAQPLSTINVGSTDIGICLEDQLVAFFKAKDVEEFNSNYFQVQERDRRTNATVIKNLSRARNKLLKEVEAITTHARTLNKVRDREELVELTRTKREREAKIANYNLQISKLEVTDKAGKSTLGAIQRAESKNRDTQALNYAEHLVSLINQKADPNLSLVTSTFMHKLGNDNGLIAMWLMPKPQYVRLLELASTGLNVKHWTWPWEL
jgi:hypothetical protein